jgi:hypothetical protein
MNSQEVVAIAAQVAELALKYAMARKHEQYGELERAADR